MAVIGYMGKYAGDGIQFVVSREVFRTPKDMRWSGSARYAAHERHATHALTEFTGLDPDSFSFDILLTAELGVDPQEELVKIWNFERNAEAVGLVIGGKAYGKYRWTIKKHETKIEYTDAAGSVYAAEVSLELLEYLTGENYITTVNTAQAPAAGVLDTGAGTAYTVRKGDSLWTIAQAFYGNAAQYNRIYEANRDVIGSNPAFIYQGQVLTIPK